MVGDLIRLKFTVAGHSPSWKRPVGLLLAIAAVALTWTASSLAESTAVGDVLSFALLVWSVGWLIGPILSSSTVVLRPEYFALMPMNRFRLGVALLASMFAGVGAVAMVLAGSTLVGYAIRIDAYQAIPVAIVAAVAFTVLVVSLSRAVYALLGSAMRSWIGVELAAIQYGLLIASLATGWLIVSPVVSATPVFLSSGFDGTTAGEVVSRLPGGWPVTAVEAAAAGDWGGALGRLLGLVVVAVLTFLATARLLRPHTGNKTLRRRRPPVGSQVLTRPRRLPATPLGAVFGKEMRAWWRDPWRGLEVRSSIWFGLFLALFAVIGGAGSLAVATGLGVAVMIGLAGANLYGQDGTALWQLVVTETDRAVRADVRGRQFAILIYFGVPALLLSVIMMVATGEYGYALPVAVALVVLLGVGSGVSVLMSVLAATPGVDPHRRVNSTDAGENEFAIQIALFATQIVAAPTLVAAGFLAFHPTPPSWLVWGTPVLAVVNGVGGGWLLGHLAVRRLTGDLAEVFGLLRYPGATLARPPRARNWMDLVVGEAEKSAAEARKSREKTAAKRHVSP